MGSGVRHVPDCGGIEVKQYLGDSVYAEWQGSSLVLTTENSDEGPSNKIYLEEFVVHELEEFIKYGEGE